jgi:hypothetical protein
VGSRPDTDVCFLFAVFLCPVQVGRRPLVYFILQLVAEVNKAERLVHEVFKKKN